MQHNYEPQQIEARNLKMMWDRVERQFTAEGFDRRQAERKLPCMLEAADELPRMRGAVRQETGYSTGFNEAAAELPRMRTRETLAKTGDSLLQ
jgi:hypothetical protein